MSRVLLDPTEISAAPAPETTVLKPAEEQQFQKWISSNKIPDLDHPDSHYDYRGYWKEFGNKPVRFGTDHFTDTYKQHGHPTFSVESQYSQGPNDGGTWAADDTFIPPKSDRILLDPSEVSDTAVAQPPVGTPAQPAAPAATGPAPKLQAYSPAQTLHAHRQAVAPPRLPGQEEESLLDPLITLLAPLRHIPVTGIAAQLRKALDTPEGQAAADTARGLATPENAAIMGGIGAANLIPFVGTAVDVGAAGYFGKQMLEAGIAAEADMQAFQQNAIDARKSGDEAAAKRFDDKARYARAQKYIATSFAVTLLKAGVKKGGEAAVSRVGEAPIISNAEVRRRVMRDQPQSGKTEPPIGFGPEREVAVPKPPAVEPEPESLGNLTGISESAPESRELYEATEVSAGPLEVEPETKPPAEAATPVEAAPLPETKPQRESTVKTFQEDFAALKQHPAIPDVVREPVIQPAAEFEQTIKNHGESLSDETLGDYIVKLRRAAELHAQDNPTIMEHIELAEEAHQSGDKGEALWEAEQARGRGGLSTEYQDRLRTEGNAGAMEAQDEELANKAEAKRIQAEQEAAREAEVQKRRAAIMAEAAPAEFPPATKEQRDAFALERQKTFGQEGKEQEIRAKELTEEPTITRPLKSPREMTDDMARDDMQHWADLVRNMRDAREAEANAGTMESNVYGKALEEEAVARSKQVGRSLGVKEGSPLAEFKESPKALLLAIDKGKGKLYERIVEAFQEAAYKLHGEEAEAFHAREAAGETTPPVEEGDTSFDFGGEDLEFTAPELPVSESVLGQTAEEGMRRLVSGRKPEQIKEGKEFDATRLVESPLFAGRGGEQRSFSDQVIEKLDTIAEETKADIQQKIRDIAAGKTVGANLPAGLLGQFVKYGAVKIAKGTVKFGQWSAEMLKDFGETIRPHLGRIYNQAFKDAQILRKTNGQLYTQPESGLKAITTPVTGMLDQIRSTFVPAEMGRSAGEMAQVVRRGAADLSMRDTLASDNLQKARHYFDKQPEDKQVNFIHAIEDPSGPEAKALTKEEAAFAKVMRKMLDDTWEQVRKRSGVQMVISDYFPHLWADPLAAEAVMRKYYAKRPLEGGKKFFKKREIMSVKDGLAAGLKLAVTNPVDNVLAQLHQENKFITGHDMVTEMKDLGLIQFRKAGSKASSQGLVQINDPIGTVYGPPVEGAQTIYGHWMAPKEAATIINNYLGPGLAGTPIFDFLRTTGNTLNQVQLGASGFHFTFTANDASISKVASGIQDLVSSRGGLTNPVRAAKGLGKVAVGMVGVGPLAYAPWEAYVRGNRVLKEFYKPGSAGQYYAAVLNDLVKAGGRLGLGMEYRTGAIDKFWTAWHQGSKTAPLRAIPALIEVLAKPVMAHWVPRLKLGVFAELSRQMLADLPLDASDMLIRETLGHAWDSVDNRMGQLVYDNLHWNRTLKDLGMITTRSLGWNLGTIRELGGAMIDTSKALGGKGRAFESGKFQITPRMAYALALPIVMGMQGATMMYLMTGHGPTELKDYFYPKTGKIMPTGEPERVSNPSYMKDVVAYGHDFPRGAIQTVSHKLHPEISMIYEMITNKDFYGTEIFHEDDPLIQRWMDKAKFIGEQYVPFSMRNLSQRLETKGFTETAKAAVKNPGTTAASFFGVVPAPKSLEQTPAERLAQRYATNKAAQGSRTKEQFERTQLRNQITRAFQAKDPTAADQEKEAIQSGKLSPSDRSTIRANVRRSTIERSMQTASLEELMNVWDVADDTEKGHLRRMIAARMKSQALTPDMRKRLIPRAQAALAEK